MRVSVCLGAILIPEYLDLHSGYFYSQEQNSWNIFRNVFRNKFLFRNIPNERALINLSEFTVNDYKCTTMTWLQTESWQQKSKGYFVVCVRSLFPFHTEKGTLLFSMK